MSDLCRQTLERLKDEHRLRSIPPDKSHDGIMIDLCSNDYLGLGTRGEIFMPEFYSRFADAQFTSSASRLLSSRQKYHLMLEEKLGDLYGRDSLLFNSGYHANVGCISALSGSSTLFICDKLVHASIVDGLRVGNARFVRFPHNDIDSLERLLDRHEGDYGRIVIVTESIFSMDGDEAPLHRLVSLKKRHPKVMLYLDEAHALGVRGRYGLGCSEEAGLIGDFDIIIGTFGKALASAGAFVITDSILKDYFINTARPFIFSTALPPANIAWTILMLEKSISMEASRERLRDIAGRFRDSLAAMGADTAHSTSQIVPVITADASKALDLSVKLRHDGFDVLPIRRPTVPPGTERIRLSLNADTAPHDLERLVSTLDGYLNPANRPHA